MQPLELQVCTSGASAGDTRYPRGASLPIRIELCSHTFDLQVFSNGANWTDFLTMELRQRVADGSFQAIPLDWTAVPSTHLPEVDPARVGSRSTAICVIPAAITGHLPPGEYMLTGTLDTRDVANAALPSIWVTSLPWGLMVYAAEGTEADALEFTHRIEKAQKRLAYAEAEVLALEWVRLTPTDPEPWSYLGGIRLCARNWHGAIHANETFLRLSPSSAGCHWGQMSARKNLELAHERMQRRVLELQIGLAGEGMIGLGPSGPRYRGGNPQTGAGSPLLGT